MLAIKKRYQSLRAVSAGSLAFAIGLAGAAAYIGSNLVHQNLTFNKEQPSISRPAEPSSENPGTVTVDQSSQQGAVYVEPEPAPVVAPTGSETTVQAVVTPATETTSATSDASSTGPTTLCSELVLPSLPNPGVNCLLP